VSGGLTRLTGVRAVVFDAVGTLLRPEPAVGVAYAQAARRLGSTRDAAEVQARFRTAWQAEEARDRDTGGLRSDDTGGLRSDDTGGLRSVNSSGLRTDEARERLRWQRIVAEVFPEVAEQDDLFAELWDHFADPGSWRLFDDVAETWRELEQRGLVLAIASNFDERLPGICASFAPLTRCRHVFASSAVGYRKPAVEFYGRVAAALDLPAESILMVGDDMENDVVAARQAGWQALLIARDKEQSSIADTVATLRAIPTLL
jgi:putative hydrolase of the HAD superfamily